MDSSKKQAQTLAGKAAELCRIMEQGLLPSQRDQDVLTPREFRA